MISIRLHTYTVTIYTYIDGDELKIVYFNHASLIILDKQVLHLNWCVCIASLEYRFTKLA